MSTTAVLSQKEAFNMKDIEVLFLGTRGSVSVDAKRYSVYGGATICTLIKADNEQIVFDAGSGFTDIQNHIDISKDGKATLHLFLSHTHFDHIMGLPVCDLMFNPDITIYIYGVSKDGLTIKEQIDRLMSPPIWPVSSDVFRANVIYRELTEDIQIGGILISHADGNHPGGCTMFKLKYGGKTLVYATDFEIDDSSEQKLVDFSKGADLLICDGQYDDNHATDRSGYGHSSWQRTAKVAQLGHVHRLCIFHHDPYSDDSYLTASETVLKQQNPCYFFARKGMVITL